MRFAYAAFAVVVCSNIHAQNRIDVTLKPPPPPTDVNVLNFPEVQAVAGTVSVDNLPAVQTVAGTVNVGNLPLGEDGSLRVTSSPTPARQLIWYEVLDSPVIIYPNGTMTIPNSVATDGYSSVSIRVVSAGGTSTTRLLWSLADDEDFLPVVDARNGFNSVNGFPYECGGPSNSRLVCRNIGGNVRVRLDVPLTSGQLSVTSVRVYLIP